jgi:hypothetical protein
MNMNRWLSTLPLRLRSLFRRGRVEKELNDELQFHLEQKTKEYITNGSSPPLSCSPPSPSSPVTSRPDALRASIP